MKASTPLLLTAIFLALQLITAQAQVFAVKNYKVTIAGTSTLHDWESNVEKLECNGSIVLLDHTIVDINDVAVKIPVKAIKSTKGKIMDTKTWEAFNHEKNPFITFVLTDKKINASRNTVDVSGSLTMAGVTRSIELTLVMKPLRGNEFLITGSKTLIMSDFKMVPPTAMMGTIKVGPEVTVSFDVIIHPSNNL